MEDSVRKIEESFQDFPFRLYTSSFLTMKFCSESERRERFEIRIDLKWIVEAIGTGSTQFAKDDGIFKSDK